MQDEVRVELRAVTQTEPALTEVEGNVRATRTLLIEC